MHPKYDEVIRIKDMLVVFASLETLGQIGGMKNGNHHHDNQNFFKRFIGRNR